MIEAIAKGRSPLSLPSCYLINLLQASIDTWRDKAFGLLNNYFMAVFLSKYFALERDCLKGVQNGGGHKLIDSLTTT